ncbi:unnamed protein product [Ilex paraguariensis]|uniref:Uncharacterized protein n=1 Tax=Ilex paraguariensis TaxID=185542 RepID=A0ABC8QR30_9AQUA
MSGEEGKSRGVAATGGASEPQAVPPEYYYGTFQGVANYQQQPPPPQPVIGFPQPTPPSGLHGNPPHYYSHGYQTVPGYAISEGGIILVREHRLPCCGIGIGWLL